MDRIAITEDLSFSRIVYGMWRLDEDADTSPAHVRAKIEACLDQGITTIDQADIYGGYASEALLGAALKGTDLARQVEIVTKTDIVVRSDRFPDARVKHYDTSRAHITAAVETSLTLMGVERIDLLLIHRPDPLMDHNETGETLDDLVAAGKVRAVGVSNFRPWDLSLLQSAMETGLAVNQIELSLTCHDAFTNGDLAFLQENDIVPMAWSPLGGGGLLAGGGAVQAKLREVAGRTGADPAAVAVAWLLAHPAGILPVMGTNRLDRIRAFSDALEVPMDRQTWFELYTAALGREVA
ncbi:aldo/keto reductase [Palleronia sp. KMU-117]|uniref:aldo/keto reductase n=1 Tax=Palleronia sp. KMU-117 TaxID=3434108 RepID=UPI003D744B58